MSKMKMFVTDSYFLNGQQVEENIWRIPVGTAEIIVEENPVWNGKTLLWRVDRQYFDKEEFALDYLKRLIAEKATGCRIIYHAKSKVPDICGVEGRACRLPMECNSALCSTCPVAEKFFADRDGVKLIYAGRPAEADSWNQQTKEESFSYTSFISYF